MTSLSHAISISFAGDLSFMGDHAKTYLANALSSAMALPELKGDSTCTVAMRAAFHNWVDIIDSNSAFAKLLQNIVDHAFGSSM